MDYDKLKTQLQIDKHNLDNELIRQPMLLQEASEAYSIAAAERDAAKEDLASVDASLDIEARKTLSGDKKRLTEGEVRSFIQMHKAHHKAFSDFLNAKEDADRLFSLKEAFQQRGYMLRDLASLYVANYFENNSVQGTSSTDTLAYNKRRVKLAQARQERNK